MYKKAQHHKKLRDHEVTYEERRILESEKNLTQTLDRDSRL
jgi:hypothetical protein